LRDTIVGFDTEGFKQDETHERGALRHRQREVPPKESPSG
jgi:hypothetical protein